MLTAPDYESALDKLQNISSTCFCFLFANPKDKIVQDTVLPYLEELHFYTGNNANVFCAGYGKYCTADYSDDTTITACTIANEDWYFSTKKLINLAKRIETRSDYQWRYSGKTELLIVPIQKTEGKYNFCFDSIVSINFEDLIERNHVKFFKTCIYDLVHFIQDTKQAEIDFNKFSTKIKGNWWSSIKSYVCKVILKLEIQSIGGAIPGFNVILKENFLSNNSNFT
ncbi:MAG: hypothetical protein Q4G68_07890 [Planctomycetia bacterium]|nr:hypothetical protein [Planctomycetia bacterium]